MKPEPVPASVAVHLLAAEIEALWQLIAELGSAELQEAAQEQARRLADRLGSSGTPVH